MGLPQKRRFVERAQDSLVIAPQHETSRFNGGKSIPLSPRVREVGMAQRSLEQSLHGSFRPTLADGIKSVACATVFCDCAVQKNVVQARRTSASIDWRDR
jgi:hypothetical protein